MPEQKAERRRHFGAAVRAMLDWVPPPLDIAELRGHHRGRTQDRPMQVVPAILMSIDPARVITRGVLAVLASLVLLIAISVAGSASAGAAEQSDHHVVTSGGHSDHHASRMTDHIRTVSAETGAGTLEVPSATDDCHRNDSCCAMACGGAALATVWVSPWPAIRSSRVGAMPTQSTRGLAAEPLRRPPRAISG
ncbi:MAG: hypothetical protein EXR01_09320 [Acetobacteraceae bacterium]|nr:hypothetical protein [Acetobacteraceae bacterium]